MNTTHSAAVENTAERLSIDSASGQAQQSKAQQLKANILIVDDRPDKLLALESVLERLGQNVVKARSGKEALRCLLQRDFAVILLDVSMPGMDGFETAALIRSRLRSERTPIIFVTSFGNTETHISRGYSLGAVDYLLTPILPEVLCTKVSVFVDLYKQTELIKQQAEQLRTLEEARHSRELALVSDRLETETKRNRFFTLAIDLLGIADFTCRLFQVNPSWELTLGYAEKEFCARPLVDFVDPEDHDAFLHHLERAQDDKSPVRFGARFVHKDGCRRCLSISLVPFPSEQLLYLFAKDVTSQRESDNEIQRLNDALQQKVSALTAANTELEAFNYSIAHDLRAPLRSMSSFATALLEDEKDRLSTEGVEFAQRIARSAKYMDKLLQDLVSYGSLCQAAITVEEVSLESEVRETISLFSALITKCGAHVSITQPLHSVRAHAPTVRRILTNLLDNALKFCSADRTPVVRFYSTENERRVRLWVEDNGLGIPAEHQERIFGIFRRLHHGDQYPGTGIGLAVVRRAAERMGGRVGVESTPDHGSRFWIELPA